MFPIHDRRGRVIAFGGRVIGKDEGPKYLNSPETALFHKGRELYGLWHARQAHSKLSRLIVVEGYMDVVSLWQSGITQAVATLGTATTPEHAELLFRNSADVYFCFDGDAAGRRAAWKALESVLPRMGDGRQAFFLFLPEGEDPDSLVRAHGGTGFEAALGEALPLSEFLFRQLAEDSDLGSADGKARLAERAKALIERLPEGEFRDRMEALRVQRTAVGFHASARLGDYTRELVQLGERVQQDAYALAKGRVPDGYLVEGPRRRGLSAPRPSGGEPRRSLVRTAIALLLAQPDLADEAGPALPWIETLEQPGVPLLVELLRAIGERRPPNTGALLEAFAGHPQAEALRKLATLALHGDAAALAADFRGALRQLRRQAIHQRLDWLKAQPQLDEAGRAELRALLTDRD